MKLKNLASKLKDVAFGASGFGSLIAVWLGCLAILMCAGFALRALLVGMAWMGSRTGEPLVLLAVVGIAFVWASKTGKKWIFNHLMIAGAILGPLIACCSNDLLKVSKTEYENADKAERGGNDLAGLVFGSLLWFGIAQHTHKRSKAEDNETL